MMKNTIVYISVLNWNKADSTLCCVRALKTLTIPAHTQVTLFVVDNGSEQDDWETLSAGTHQFDPTIVLVRLETNLGFAGGHNLILSKAIVDGADYVWLVNNDGLPKTDTLLKMLELMESDPKCGVVSPLIIDIDTGEVTFSGAYHDWAKLSVEYNSNDHTFFEHNIENAWVFGTAFMFRTAAMQCVGLLDENLFAYLEDNEICARLATHGWTSKVAFDAQFSHVYAPTRASYFYYLMARNAIIFWIKYTPQAYRRFIYAKMLEQGLFKYNLLQHGGLFANAQASLLGTYDGLLNRGGRPPPLTRQAPWFMRFLCWLRQPFHYAHIKKYYQNIT